MKKIKIFIATLVIMGTLGMNLSFADGLSSLDISQFVVAENELNVYFDLSDESGKHVPIDNLDIQIKVKSLTDEEIPITVSHMDKYDKAAEGTGYVLLIDVSDSVKNFADMKSAMLDFIKELDVKDSVAVMTFGDSVSLDQEFTSDKTKLEAAITNLKAEEDWTKLYEGLIRAENYCQGVDPSVSERRTIVLLSDGYDYNSGGDTKMDVITELRRSKAYPIYALQFDPGNDDEKKTMVESLGDIVDMSNGKFMTLAGSTIKNCYETIFTDIENEYVAVLQGNLEAGKYIIQMTTTVDQMEVSDKIEINLNQAIEAAILPEETTTNENEEGQVEEGSQESTEAIDEADNSTTEVQAEEDVDKEASGSHLTNLILLIVMGLFTLVIIALVILLLTTRKKYHKKNIAVTMATETKAITLKPFHSNGFNTIAHNLGKHTVLGKSKKTADIYIDFDPQVLEEHLILSAMNGYVYISKAVPQADLYINGLPVDNKRELRSGDVISFADIEMVISF